MHVQAHGHASSKLATRAQRYSMHSKCTPDKVADVRNVDAHSDIPIVQPLHRQRIIQVSRRRRVDGENALVSQVAPPRKVGVGDSPPRSRQLRQHLGVQLNNSNEYAESGGHGLRQRRAATEQVGLEGKSQQVHVAGLHL